MPQKLKRLMAQPVRNRLLKALPPGDLDQIRPLLSPVELKLKAAVTVQHQPCKALYFVELGTVSMIALMEDGSGMEVGLVGREGVVGLSLLLGAENEALDGMVQVEGTALQLSAADLPSVLISTPSLLPLLLRYVDSMLAQVTQSAACNGRHRIEQRLARWVLMTHDRTEGDHFPMTQEFLSTMLGVQRPGVSVAVATLSRAGLLTHQGGYMRVIDRQGLEAASCECYQIARNRFSWLLKLLKTRERITTWDCSS